MAKRPNSVRNLDAAIRRYSSMHGMPYVETRTLIVNALVAQMLPDGVIKGGSAMKVRYGNEGTRFTKDLDTATSLSIKEYQQQLAHSLAIGWEGFTGTIVKNQPPSPDGVPEEYVMQPFSIKMLYLEKPWCTVPLEVGPNEIGDADEGVRFEQIEASRVMEELGFPSLGDANLMPISYQVAQKLHGLTGPGDRVRDLIDLQLIANNEDLDYSEINRVCKRLFAYRGEQPWPPYVVPNFGWERIYRQLAEGLPVFENLSDAVAWANDLILLIKDHEPQNRE